MKKKCLFRKIELLVFGIVIIFCVTACAPRYNRYGLPQYGYEYQVPQKLDDGWQTASLAAEGVDSEKINEMIRNILDGKIDNIHGVVVIKNGKLVLEEYFDGFDRDTKHRIFSASKSVTSILVGMAMDQKKISGVDTKVYEFFPEYEGTQWVDQRYDIKLKHVLTMTAGLDWNADYPGYDSRSTTRKMSLSGDWIKFVLNRDVIEPPGSQFKYNNGLTTLLGGIVKNTTGLYADEFAEKHLFAPLDISDYSWDKGPNGEVNTAWGLSLKPRDMAKIGYLFLHQGKWNGKQIVSPKWVNESVRDHVAQYTLFGSGYGYQWWCGETEINEQHIETFYAAGHGGQYIFVTPSLDCVAVITSKWLGNPFGEFRPQMLLTNYIVPAMLPSASPKRIEIDPMTLERCVGEYEYQKWKLKVTVRRKGDTLYLHVPKNGDGKLIPVTEDQFLYTWDEYGDVQLHFTKDRKGDINQIVAYFGFANVTFNKIG